MRSITRLLLILTALLILPPWVDAQAQGVKFRPGVTRSVTSGSTDTATSQDYWGYIAWRSAVTSPKSETLPACTSANNGMWVGVIDEQATAATYNITVAAASGNVGGASGGVFISSNLGAAIFSCDGANNNWNVAAQFAPGANVRSVTGTSDAILSSDNGGLITYNNANPVAVSLSAAGSVGFPKNSFMFLVRNYGAGTVTITPATSTINNGNTTLPLTQNQGAIIFADGGANYQVVLTSTGGGSGSATLNPGLATSPTSYNAATQTIVSGQTLSLQLFYEAHATSYSLLSTDGGKLLTATAASVTFTAPNPGASGTTGFQFGYDGSHGYTVTTTGGTASIYGCGASGTSVALASGAAITPDGTNYQCTPFGSSSGGGGSLSGMTAGQFPVAATASTVTSSVFLNQYMAGLIPSNDGGTPNSVIDVSKGIAADDTNVLMMVLASNFTKSIAGGTFTAGTGNRCLDTGALAASTWYYVFLISNASGSTVDVLCSASISTPTLPSGYTLKRWIGDFATNGSSNIRAFSTLDGHLYKWQVATVTTATATTSQTLTTLDVPLGVLITPLCRVSMSNASPPQSVLITDPYVTDAAPSTATPFTTAPGWDQIDVTLTSGDFNAVCPSGLMTNTSGQVATHASATATTVNFVNKGWIQ